MNFLTDKDVLCTESEFLTTNKVLFLTDIGSTFQYPMEGCVYTAVCHLILSTYKSRGLTWPSGKHRGFCIITKKDSVRSYFC